MSEHDEPLEPRHGNPVMDFRPSKLRAIEPHELAIRFVFGVVVSLLAALAGKLTSSTVGGVFLAFPAILPATLTLLEKKHGTDNAEHDDRGAVLGGFGLVAFAIAAALLFERTSAAVVLVVALVAWIVFALGSYLVIAPRTARE